MREALKLFTSSLYNSLLPEFMDRELLKKRVMSGEATKISDSPDNFNCRFCFKKAVCWEGMKVPVRCSTCKFAFPREDGGWHCDKHDREAFHPCQDYEIYKPKEKGT